MLKLQDGPNPQTLILCVSVPLEQNRLYNQLQPTTPRRAARRPNSLATKSRPHQTPQDLCMDSFGEFFGQLSWAGHWQSAQEPVGLLISRGCMSHGPWAKSRDLVALCAFSVLACVAFVYACPVWLRVQLSSDHTSSLSATCSTA